MTYKPTIDGRRDINNSTDVNLNANASFIGKATTVIHYSNITVNITVDQSSATFGLELQFSPDGITWPVVKKYTISISSATNGAPVNEVIEESPKAEFFRIVYTNGKVAQRVMKLQTILSSVKNAVTTLRGPTEGISDYTDPITLTNTRNLNVSIAGPISALGDPRFVSPTTLTAFAFYYGLNSNYVNISTMNGGTVTASNQLALLTTTTTNGSIAKLQSRQYCDYRIGQGTLFRFTTRYSLGVESNLQISGIGDYPNNGFYFGFNGTIFGILYLRNGVSLWIPQQSWNFDNLSGLGGATNKSGMLLDVTKGNIYQISMSSSGFGNVRFFVYCDMVDRFLKIHSHRHANHNTLPLLINPSVKIEWINTNVSATTIATTFYAASGTAFIEGEKSLIGAKYGRSNTISELSDTTNTTVITLRNNAVINGMTNRTTLILQRVAFYCVEASLTSLTSNSVMLNVYLNPTLSSALTYVNTDINNSISSYSVTSVPVVAGTGTLLQSFSSCFATTQTLDLTSYDIVLNPSDILVFALITSSFVKRGAVTAGASISWVENT